MFKSLTDNFTKIFDKIRSSSVLTEGQIKEVMRDLRIALLEADVALPVVKEFVNIVSERALGQEVIKSISPSKTIIKICNDELEKLLDAGAEESELKLNKSSPVNIMFSGLQGSGKTTASAKTIHSIDGCKLVEISFKSFIFIVYLVNNLYIKDKFTINYLHMTNVYLLKG